MKRTLTVLVVALFAAGVAAAQPPGGAPPAGANPAGGAPAAAAPELTEQLKLNASYAIGVEIGKNLQKDKEALNLEMVVQGLQDSLSGQPLQLNEQQLAQVLKDFNRAMVNRELTASRQEEAQFLAGNVNQPGVKATASGLQYKVLTPGTGATPKATDMVRVHYKGTFLDGQQFDSSYDNVPPAPLDLPVNGVIDGWSEALQLMKAGDKWKLWIPAKLAYGDNPPPGPIPPAKMLVFEVELVAVNPPPQTQP